MTSEPDGRPVWKVNAPTGGWPPPWPQLVEIVQAIPHTQWTLVGGLMVQLHAAHEGLQLTRPTRGAGPGVGLGPSTSAQVTYSSLAPATE